MRVLIVSNTYPPTDISGVGTLAYEMARQLGASGHGATVLTRVAPEGDPWADGTGGAKLLFPLLAGLRYWKLSGERAYDLVHVHESDGVVVAWLLRLARLFGGHRGRARLVSTLQVSYRRERLAVRPLRSRPGDPGSVVSRPARSERIFAWTRAPLLAVLGRMTARLSDSVVAPSAATAAELRQDYRARAPQVIPNGIPPVARREAGVENDAPTILFAGRLRTRKAAAVLLEAFAVLRERLPDAVLVLAGDGEQRRALEAQREALGLGESVRFLGLVPRHELGAWYARAHVFCLPSTYEGFPLAILEAMAAGLPVVATAVAGVPEAVEDGVTGRVVPPEDAPALAEALVSVLSDGEARLRMGEAGRRAVAENFAIANVSEAYLDHWKSLVESGHD